MLAPKPRIGLFVDICCVKLLRATRVARHKPFRTPGLHAINQGSNAGDHIAYNPASGAEFTGPLACRFRERYDLQQFLRWFPQAKRRKGNGQAASLDAGRTPRSILLRAWV